ncbi:MAG: MATE family efflux transporter [Lentimicrobiaceae bacterium]|nr:MATE family efflux transporter [Lentimicrobiaceae bacterium]
MNFQKRDFSAILEVSQPDSNLKQLIRLAFPVIVTSFMSMAYNFINIIFVGKLGAGAVAAVGSAGFYMNLGWGLSSLFTVGAGIKVSHAIGEGNFRLAKSYIRSGMLAVIVTALVCSVLLAFGRNYLIGFIQLNNPGIERDASVYLALIGLSIIFSFQNQFYTSVFIGYGDSRSPFRINAAALIVNILLDAILIFWVGLGINGAAIATILSQALATFLFYRKLNRTENINPGLVPFQSALLKKIVGIGISPAIQRVSFTIIAILMARIISHWGANAIAVQKVGVQIEAISYMTVAGFMYALSSISGQAYGAKDYDKQWKIFGAGIMLSVIIGVITTAILVMFPSTLFSIFLKDPESIAMGREYLTIIGISQLFMCLELMATGAFFGWGRTNIPAITGIGLTLLRIPLAYALIHLWKNELSSVWWSISISSIAKGILLVLLYVILFKLFIKNQKKTDETGHV